jgi:hypothetical protein
LVLLLAPAALFSATLVQKNPPVRPADADSPVLIWDVDPKLAKSLPRNFRTTDDPLKANKGQIPSNTGLADLHASGSGEFTTDGLKLLLARTHGPVTVFDLRQETHIFVHGLPVSGLRQTTGRMSVAVKAQSKQMRMHEWNRSNPGAKSLSDQVLPLRNPVLRRVHPRM